MRFKHIVGLIFVFGLVQACSSPKENSAEISQLSTYELALLDSVDIPILGLALLSDVSEDGSKILLYDWPGSEILVADSQGKILHRWKKNKDTPDSFGFMMSLPGFVENNQVAIVGMRGFFVYDSEGNLIRKFDHAEPMGGAAFMARTGNSVKYVSAQGRPALLYKSLRGRDTYPGAEEFYKKFRAVEFLDLGSGDFLEAGKFEEGSRFLDGMGYYESDYMPAYEFADGELFIALGNEPILRKYHIDQDSINLVASEKFELPELQIIEGKPRSSFDPNSVTIFGGTGAIQQIFKIDSKLAVSYFSGIPRETESMLDEIWEKDGQAAYEEANRKVMSEIPQGILIVDPESLKLEGEIPFPEGVNREGFVVADGAFWFEKSRNLNEEEDFIRIYKMKLIQR